MNTISASLPPYFRMAPHRTRPVGRPKTEGELATIRKEVSFTPSEWEALGTAMQPSQRIGTVLHDLGVDWANGDLLTSKAKEEFRLSVLSMAGVDDMTLPDLGAVVCGPLKEAVAEAGEFTLSSDVSTFLKIQDEDWTFDAEGQSLEGAGIPEGAKVFLRPYGERGRPSKGDIVLVEVSREDEDPSYTLKRFRKSVPFEVEDGDGNLYELPDDANLKAVAELVAYMVSK